MKKSIYITGLAVVILVLIGSIFKMMHWPGANIALMLGLGSLVLIYLPWALINNYRNVGTRRNRLLYIVIFIVCFFVYTGALFKILHWPGASLLLKIGIPLPFFLFVPVFIYTVSRDKAFSIIHTVIILLFVAYMGISSALLALGYSKNILDEGIMLNKQLAYTAVFIDLLNEQKAQQLGQTRGTEKIRFDFVNGTLKSAIAGELEGREVDAGTAADPGYLYTVSGKDNTDAVELVIFNNEENFNTLTSVITEICPEGSESDGKDVEAPVWERFASTSPAFAFPLLSDLEIGILYKEKLRMDQEIIKENP
ncbi:MAG: GldL-related protein [Bacteroidota bacterium]